MYQKASILFKNPKATLSKYAKSKYNRLNLYHNE